MVPISRINTNAQTGLMVYFLPADKKRGQSHTYTHDCYDRYSTNKKFFTHITSYILEKISVVSTATNESILAPLSKQTESFRSPHEIGCPMTSHRRPGLAILSLACLDLAADHRLNSNTYKLHRYASWLKQYKAQHYG
jgi:hypothetical protein